MTASLLARKGDAAPSVVAPSFVSPSAVPLAPRPPMPPRIEPPPFPSQPAVQTDSEYPQLPLHFSNDPEKPRRIMVAVTADELEKLGIAAIKKGLTRHQIVRAALDAYFVRLAAELPRTCNCMTSGPCCS